MWTKKKTRTWAKYAGGKKQSAKSSFFPGTMSEGGKPTVSAVRKGRANLITAPEKGER